MVPKQEATSSLLLKLTFGLLTVVGSLLTIGGQQVLERLDNIQMWEQIHDKEDSKFKVAIESRITHMEDGEQANLHRLEVLEVHDRRLDELFNTPPSKVRRSYVPAN